MLHVAATCVILLPAARAALLRLAATAVDPRNTTMASESMLQ